MNTHGDGGGWGVKFGRERYAVSEIGYYSREVRGDGGADQDGCCE